jgi:imidazolonepropionase
MNEPVHAAEDGLIADGLITGATLVTLDGDAGYGLVEDGALAWRGGVIRFAGPRAELPAELAGDAIDAGGDCITPGLVDCHTHAVFAGDRAGEFEQRLQGADYEQIARAGGGIVSTVRHTRAAGEDELLAQSLPRACALLADGVTTLEIKSGYGLDFDNERKMLRVARQVGDTLGIQVRTSFLGAHALPPEFAGNADGYIDAVVEWLPHLHAEGLVDAVDAFCERIGFTLAQTRRVFEAARALGLPVKLHADQLSDLGGAALVAEYGGLSADHIEHSSDAAVRAMAAAGTVAGEHRVGVAVDQPRRDAVATGVDRVAREFRR